MTRPSQQSSSDHDGKNFQDSLSRHLQLRASALFDQLDCLLLEHDSSSDSTLALLNEQIVDYTLSSHVFLAELENTHREILLHFTDHALTNAEKIGILSDALADSLENQSEVQSCAEQLLRAFLERIQLENTVLNILAKENLLKENDEFGLTTPLRESGSLLGKRNKDAPRYRAQ